MTILWEALPLVTLAGTNAFAVWRWDFWKSQALELDVAGYDAWCRAMDAEDELDAIREARHTSAKHARAAQIAQHKAAVLAKAAELVSEPERRAA
jgi:hypothetical protein